MIAAATQNFAWLKGMQSGLNAFDMVVLAVLAFGFWRGRRNGMSKEFLPLLKWLALVFACGFGDNLLAKYLIQSGFIHTVFGGMFKVTTAASISAYLLIAFAVFLVFNQLKVSNQKRIEGGRGFGSGEYYLGMVSGTLRYGCILIFFLALLNAPVYSWADIQHRKDFENKWFGGGLQGYSGDFIPSVDEIQSLVFRNSFLGSQIKKNLNQLLINSDGSVIQQDTAQKKPVIHIGN